MEQSGARSARRSDLERTYLEYRGLMFRLAKNILGSDELAEDAVSETVVKLLKHYDCLDSPTGPRTKRFAAVLTEHTAIDMLRRRKLERSLPLEAAEALPAPAGEPETRLDLMAALDRLPCEQRTAVLLSLSCGLSAKQTAKAMNCSVSKAEKLISRGKAALRGQLKEVEP